ncbi:MAG: glycosyltransferase family 2 protein [Promethearchaeota archaeon]
MNSDNRYLYPELKIGIIMPAFNEEKNITLTLSHMPNNITKYLDIIVIDDGSTDNTSKIAASYGVILIKHHKNKGYGAAVNTGLKFCKKKNYDIVIILDADFQHHPKFIPKFIEPILNDGVDFVIANRFKYYYDYTILKKLCIKIICAFYRFFLRKKVSDPTNGYRALSSKVVKFLELESKYSISQEMLIKVLPRFNYKEIDIQLYKRRYGSSFISIKIYFFKIIFMLIKYYLFPKLRRFTNRYISPNIRRTVGIHVLNT